MTVSKNATDEVHHFNFVINIHVLSVVVYQEAKVKKIKAKMERKEKKMFSSKDDEHFLLTGVKLTDRRG